MVEIYVIKCTTTGKEYVGQTVCQVYISTEQSYQDAVGFLHKLRFMRRDTLMREHPKAAATHPPVATQAETTVNGRTQ